MCIFTCPIWVHMYERLKFVFFYDELVHMKKVWNVLMKNALLTILPFTWPLLATSVWIAAHCGLLKNVHIHHTLLEILYFWNVLNLKAISYNNASLKSLIFLFDPSHWVVILWEWFRSQKQNSLYSSGSQKG